MTTEFTVILVDRPGALARFGTLLGDAGVNIEAIQGTNRDGRGVVQFVAGDPNGVLVRAHGAVGSAPCRAPAAPPSLCNSATVGTVDQRFGAPGAAH